MLIYVDKYVDIGGSGDNYVDNHDDYQHKITVEIMMLVIIVVTMLKLLL